ncbi:MAG: GNAT family N-acetyltransferase [Deltaproteobacteria bacterium]|nr:GNAT family N-acetyltransferase [Deltaproteobacteria bacterium]
MLMIKIKEYSDKYKKGIIDLILNIQNNEFNICITSDQQPDLHNIKDYYQTGCGNFWVAVKSGKVIGTISLIDIGDNQAALRKMFVHQDYRGSTHSAAKYLLSELLKWSKSKSVKEIYLGTTSKFLAAHRFYEKNQFVEVNKSMLPKSFPVMEVDTKFYKLNL